MQIGSGLTHFCHVLTVCLICDYKLSINIDEFISCFSVALNTVVSTTEGKVNVLIKFVGQIWNKMEV